MQKWQKYLRLFWKAWKSNLKWKIKISKDKTTKNNAGQSVTLIDRVEEREREREKERERGGREGGERGGRDRGEGERETNCADNGAISIFCSFCKIQFKLDNVTIF